MASYKAEICLKKKANPSTNFPFFFRSESRNKKHLELNYSVIFVTKIGTKSK